MRRALPTLAAALLTLAILAPFAWMVSVSLMPAGTAARVPAPLVPSAPTLSNYVKLVTDYHLLRPLLNSLGLALVATMLGLLLFVPAGFALAKLPFRGRAAMIAGLTALMIVPGQVAMLPLFLVVGKARLVNSYLGLLIPSLAAPFAILYVRQALLGFPDEMLDAARLDGASEPQILRRVVLPLLRPTLASLATMLFFANWSDFLWPLIVLSDQDLYTLPVALAALSREHVQDAELMMAGAVVTTAPVLLVFLPLQRFYIGGLLSGSIKG